MIDVVDVFTLQMIARGKNASDLFPAVVKNVACKNIEVCNHSAYCLFGGFLLQMEFLWLTKVTIWIFFFLICIVLSDFQKPREVGIYRT